MSLSKTQKKAVIALSGNAKFKHNAIGLLLFFSYTIIPLCLVIWMEFFDGSKKIDNLMIVYMVIMIGLCTLMQLLGLVLCIIYTIAGDDIVKASIKKNIKSGDGIKESAKTFSTISMGLRTTVQSVIKSTMSFSLICLLIYTGHIILGSLLMILFITFRSLMYYCKVVIEELLKNHFLSEEKPESKGEIVIEAIDIEIVE